MLSLNIFLTAAIPLVLFLRSMFFRRRPSRLSAGLAKFKHNVDLAVWIFLGLIGCTVVYAASRLIWAWWVS